MVPIVFFDIAGPDDEKLREFYTTVFGWRFSDDGQTQVSAGSSFSGAIRRDPAEKRLYLGVSDVTETLAEVEANGGSVDTPRFEVPGLVVLGLFRDPAGNPMGLVEMEGNWPKVP